MNEIDLNQSGIYAITSPSGKRYVGSAVCIRQRWATHKSSLARGKHHCAALQRAYHKYDGDLVYSVLVLCPKEELIKEEQWYMDSSAAGTLYNSYLVAGSPLGTKRSPEANAKTAASLRGQKRGPYTAEHREKIRIASTGRVVSEQTRAKLSARVVTEATREKLRVAATGRKATPETLAKLRGQIWSEERRAQACGRKHSQESCVKMSRSRTGLKYANNKSGYVGVCLMKKLGKWQANAKINKTQIYLGVYPTPELANQARQNFDQILDYYDHS